MSLYLREDVYKRQELNHYEGGNMFNNEIPLIIVCDEKEVKYADYLIQLISEKKENTLSVSATIFTDKQYKDLSLIHI